MAMLWHWLIGSLGGVYAACALGVLAAGQVLDRLIARKHAEWRERNKEWLE